jgi:undecaprenyl-diphosphatase
VTVLVPALLGILQGLTEFLPVSSTAHLLIAGDLLRFDDPGEAFTVMIQLGAILAVIWLYRAKILSVITGLPSSPAARRFALMVLIAFAPALVAGALLNDLVANVLAESPAVIAVAFIVGGIIMLAVESAKPDVLVREADQTPLSRALGIGLCQMVALVPGVSRSGATIVGARLLGLDRAAAAEFSFFLAIPTMIAAFVYKMYDTWPFLTPERMGSIAIGFVMAFVAALIVVKPFLAFVARSGFVPFAWYRIVAGVVLLAAIAGGWLP